MKKEPTLDYVLKKLEGDPGIAVKDLDKDTLIKVITNSGNTYTIRILEPGDREIER